MEAVRTSETSVYSNETTRCYIQESSHVHTRSRENLISHKTIFIYDAVSTGEVKSYQKNFTFEGMDRKKTKLRSYAHSGNTLHYADKHILQQSKQMFSSLIT
jgi:hypothetical protein